jgi:flavin-dependent dehydrogenase
VIGRAGKWSGDGLFLATGKHDVRGAPRPRRSGDPALGLRVRLPARHVSGSALAGRIELHLFAGGYAGIVLQEDHSANVCLALRKSLLSSTGGDPVSLLQRLGDDNPVFGERLGETWRTSRFDSIGSVPYGFLAHDTAPGLFRVGDQAAVIPSLAGEGIDIALASGTLAAQHWTTGGPAAAPAFQRAFAARAALPVRTAGLAWSLAENPRLASSGVTFAARFPALVRWLMRATRV